MSKPESVTTIESMTQIAAIAARDGLELAIKEQERLIGGDEEWLKKNDHADYFKKQKEDRKKAIEQLKRLRAELHGRVFDAYKEENPDYAR